MIATNTGRTNIASLTLNQETLQDLSERESQAVLGGGSADCMTIADTGKDGGKGGRDIQRTGLGFDDKAANTLPVFGGK